MAAPVRSAIQSTHGRLRIAPPAVCPQHPRSLVYAEKARRPWSDFYDKRGWRCFPTGRKAKGEPSHRFYTADEMRRHPTRALPDFHDECGTCGTTYALDDGPRMGRGFTLVADESARCLLTIGQGESGRESAKAARALAKRYKFVTEWERDPVTREILRLKNGGPDRERVPDRYSRQGNLSAYYLDALAPAVIAERAPHAWPAVIAVDSQPLRSRRFAPGKKKRGEKGTSGGQEAGVILGVTDRTTRPGRCHTLWIAGGKDAQEWMDLFRRPDYDPASGPVWVVADADPAIEAAVRAVWPDAILFRCEGHMIRRARKWAEADGIPKWVRKKGAPPEAIAKTAKARLPTSSSPDTFEPAEEPDPRLFEKHPVWVAIERMFYGLQFWDAMKAVVEERVPKSKNALRAWITDNEPLVLRQFELRREHPSMPTSNGSIEAVLGWVRTKFICRAGRFGNARRLQTILDLMALQSAGRADERLYSRIIRAHMAAQPGGGTGVPRDEWADRFCDDAGRPSSLARLIKRSDDRQAAAQSTREMRAHDTRDAGLIAADEAQRAAQGRPPGGRRRRAPDAPPITGTQDRRGKKVKDFPCFAEWDYDANPGLDPETLPAAYKEAVNWKCTAHMADAIPHAHRFPAAPASRTRANSGCPFCMNRQVCPSNCLAADTPAALDEWDWEANGDMTPYTILPRADKWVMWTCLRDPAHPSYPQKASAHIGQYESCPLHPEDGPETRRLRAEADRIRRTEAAAAARRRLETDDAPPARHWSAPRPRTEIVPLEDPTLPLFDDVEFDFDPDLAATPEDLEYNANYETMIKDLGWPLPPGEDF